MRNNIKQKSLGKNAILNVFRTLMSLVFPVLTFPYILRVLGPVSVGKVSFSQSIIAIFAIIASLGVTSYGIRGAAAVRDDQNKLSKFSKELFVINIISTVIAYFFLFVSLFAVPKLHDYRKLLIICSGTILFTTLGMEWLYSAMEEYAYITIRSVVFQILSLICLFIVVKNENDYYKYAFIGVAANVGSNICNFVHSYKLVNLFTKERLELKQHLKPIFTLFALGVAATVYTALDSTMLGFISGDYQVGLYSVATKLNRLVSLLVTSAGMVFLPRLSYYKLGKNDNEEFVNLLYKSFDIIILFAVPAAFGLCILSEPIVWLFGGKEYMDAVIIMRVLNPIIIILGISNVTGVQLFVPLKREKWTLYSVLIGAVLNFMLNSIMIPAYGAFGAAVASVCAEGAVTTVQLFLSRRYIKVLNVLKLVVKYVVLSILMCIPVVLCVELIRNYVIQCIIGVIIGALFYLFLLLLTKNELVQLVLREVRPKVR